MAEVRLGCSCVLGRVQMSIVNGLQLNANRQVKRWRYFGIYRRFRDFTMIHPHTYVENLILAERVRQTSGCVVECGVWRGGMSAGMATILGTDRRYFLLDSFEGLPKAREVDGPAAIAYQKDTLSETYYDNCTSPPEFAERAMKLAGVHGFALIKGWFEHTLPHFDPPEPIALLRLDADWYDSTRVCLEHLFPRVAPGGLVLIDDYYTYDGCSRAVHDFLSDHSAVERIRTERNVCFLIKV